MSSADVSFPTLLFLNSRSSLKGKSPHYTINMPLLRGITMSPGSFIQASRSSAIILADQRDVESSRISGVHAPTALLRHCYMSVTICTETVNVLHTGIFICSRTLLEIINLRLGYFDQLLNKCFTFERVRLHIYFYQLEYEQLPKFLACSRIQSEPVFRIRICQS